MALLVMCLDVLMPCSFDLQFDPVTFKQTVLTFVIATQQIKLPGST